MKASMEDFRRLAADLRSRFSASAAKTGLGTKEARCYHIDHGIKKREVGRPWEREG